ncbi:bifunctional 3-(3-hydroxy-phenyl)propionate/3-hydroxycinnamic acid hydroxylase [Nocardia flavorosea]|uniref:Bifunctional 3-(3-hydroxy-phenyl)propionate/3-hydroxycinnamic acid hydroxylase n=1 Tax=Nocardia flavorosea TaxID=53429 RepID=A0A846YP14_9NOCA|nr:bifunctional 3-(3-hydroxy-phenyl)propionate/3-hydroxycinnamic acid hydroxylase [Nocardia flavorosea]NKY60855.1 bifunctional 3-(3-hydroxy-phenyl)propionate/3-hydroxycinnamic acid hydroxylase [Nocardia flavorosea]
MTARTLPVVIVGAGPTGLTAATLLAQYGVESVVLERWGGVYPRPRAVHLDGEVRRVLARLGVDAEFAARSRPALGLRLLDRDMRLLAQFDRDPTGGRNGYPEANLFDQPELETMLRDNLGRYSSATLRGNAEVSAIVPENDCVRVDFVDRLNGSADSVRARYVLGCDGANSIVRSALGSPMRDLGYSQRWLVLDIATTAELGQWDGVHQVCDPVRAATYMRIGATRYRWEFRLLPGESAADFADPHRLRPLLQPWTGKISQEELTLLRVAEYTFRARLAERWRRGPLFILGDAAHLTPPFIGQGLGAGLRDAANLTWKLAGVLRGELSGNALDTYETERKPHARTMIRLAKLTGATMTDGGRLGNRLRRLMAPHLHRAPGLTRPITSGETPPLRRSELIAPRRSPRHLAGRLIPNPLLDNGRRLDDAVAGRYAIITATPPRPPEIRTVENRGAVLIDALPGSDLHRWLGRTHAVLIRPDGTVQRSGRDLPSLCAALPHRRPSSDT